MPANGLSNGNVYDPDTPNCPNVTATLEYWAGNPLVLKRTLNLTKSPGVPSWGYATPILPDTYRMIATETAGGRKETKDGVVISSAPPATTVNFSNLQ